MSEEYQNSLQKFAEIVGGKPDLSTSVIQPKNQDFTEDDIAHLDRIYAEFDENNYTFLAMSCVALDAYFKSLIPAEKWDKVRIAVADVAPRVG
jgi:hypothetical protein